MTEQTIDNEIDDEQVQDVEPTDTPISFESFWPKDSTDTPAEVGAAEPDGGEDQPETFPRQYVEELRTENARYRTQAKTADGLAQRLHVALVAATGSLADPTDLPFDAEHIDDADKLAAAIDDLLERKPHLKSRRVVGDVGQGDRGKSAESVDLSAMLRQRA